MDTEGSAPASLCSPLPTPLSHKRWHSLTGRQGWGKPQPSMAAEPSTRINQIKAKTQEEVKRGLGRRGKGYEGGALHCLEAPRTQSTKTFQQSVKTFQWPTFSCTCIGLNPPMKPLPMSHLLLPWGTEDTLGPVQPQCLGEWRDTTAQNILSCKGSTGITASSFCSGGAKVLQGFQLQGKWQDHYPRVMVTSEIPPRHKLVRFSFSAMTLCCHSASEGACLGDHCAYRLSTLLETTRIHQEGFMHYIHIMQLPSHGISSEQGTHLAGAAANLTL